MRAPLLAGASLGLVLGFGLNSMLQGGGGDEPQQEVDSRLELGRAESRALRLERDELLADGLRLRTELAEREARHLHREQEWLEFTRTLSALKVPRSVEVPTEPGFLVQPEEEVQVEPAAGVDSGEWKLAEARALRARNDLNALLVAEHVFALDVLEIGRVNQGWAGPVVVRELDDRGRLIGTLAADRFRLEASRAGRSVTLVFEVGWESRGGVRIPFGPPEQEGGDRGGARRVNLPGVDPAPWIEVLPELLRREDLRSTPDDGLWNLVELRLLLDERLRLDSPAGRWRMVALGGVMDGELHDVHLAELDSERRVVRRIFADTLRVRARGGGLELYLRDGVIERDGEKSPFLDGRYRLFMPDARVEVWEGTGVPGLSDPPR